MPRPVVRPETDVLPAMLLPPFPRRMARRLAQVAGGFRSSPLYCTRLPCSFTSRACTSPVTGT
jgi:hypothetical protein